MTGYADVTSTKRVPRYERNHETKASFGTRRTVNAFSCFPGLKTVGWGGLAGTGRTRFASPTGMVTSAGLSLSYPKTTS